MADLQTLAQKLSTTGPHKTEPSPRRVRLLFNGKFIADDLRPTYVWEHPYYPQYYIHAESFVDGVLAKSEGGEVSKGVSAGKLVVDGRETERVLVFGEGAGALAGLVRVEFGSIDAWFEEDEQIFCHPKDPYKRIDILPASSRLIQIKIDGTLVAETRSAYMLFETGLKTRYYMPLTSLVDVGSVRESRTESVCPYKGVANYYDLTVNGKVHKDVIWFYKNPIMESIRIAGLVCFYNEKVEVWVDGVKEVLR